MKKISEFTLAGISAGMLVGVLAVVGAAHAQTPGIPLSPTYTGTSSTGTTNTAGDATVNTTSVSTSSNAITPGSSGSTGILSPSGNATTDTTGASTSSNAITPNSSTVLPTGNASGAGSTTASTSPSSSVTSPTLTTPFSTTALPMPMVVNIGSAGDILLRGIVVATTADSVMIHSWDGQWTVHVGPSITVAPLGTGSALSGIAVGDYVGVLGTVTGSQPLTVEATYVRDWTKTPTTGTGTPAASSSLTPSANASADTGTSTASTSSASSSALPAGTTLYTGTVTDVGSSTLTIMSADGTTSYTVAVGPSATVWNTARTDIPLSSIQTGDSVRIDGTLSGTTLTAAVLRDISR